MTEDCPIYEQIAQLRKKRGITMQSAADTISISRPSYGNYEKGKKKLSLEEAKKFSSMLGIPLNAFIDGHIPNNEKYKQMMLTFLKYLSVKVPKTKLAKLLYLADFAWYYENLESMSGMEYKKLKYGPVASEYFMNIEDLLDSGVLCVDTKTSSGAMLIGLTSSVRTIASDCLIQEEIDLIEKIAEKWKKKNTKEIVYFTHNQLPYKLARKGEVISYALITQEDGNMIY